MELNHPPRKAWDIAAHQFGSCYGCFKTLKFPERNFTELQQSIYDAYVDLVCLLEYPGYAIAKLVQDCARLGRRALVVNI
eukprot:310993-Amphidinium_carterae.1